MNRLRPAGLRVDVKKCEINTAYHLTFDSHTGTSVYRALVYKANLPPIPDNCFVLCTGFGVYRKSGVQDRL